MNVIAALTAMLIIGAQPNAGKSNSAYDNKYVRFEFTLDHTDFTPGETGTLSVFLTPNTGVHINTDPPIEYQFEKKAHVTFTAKATMPKDSVTGYLDTQKPATISFTLDKNISPGIYSIKGKVKYFFCSETEGWCNQFAQPVTVIIRVKK